MFIIYYSEHLPSLVFPSVVFSVMKEDIMVLVFFSKLWENFILFLRKKPEKCKLIFYCLRLINWHYFLYGRRENVRKTSNHSSRRADTFIHGSSSKSLIKSLKHNLFSIHYEAKSILIETLWKLLICKSGNLFYDFSVTIRSVLDLWMYQGK